MPALPRPVRVSNASANTRCAQIDLSMRCQHTMRTCTRTKTPNFPPCLISLLLIHFLQRALGRQNTFACCNFQAGCFGVVKWPICHGHLMCVCESMRGADTHVCGSHSLASSSQARESDAQVHARRYVHLRTTQTRILSPNSGRWKNCTPFWRWARTHTPQKKTPDEAAEQCIPSEQPALEGKAPLTGPPSICSHTYRDQPAHLESLVRNETLHQATYNL